MLTCIAEAGVEVRPHTVSGPECPRMASRDHVEFTRLFFCPPPSTHTSFITTKCPFNTVLMIEIGSVQINLSIGREENPARRNTLVPLLRVPIEIFDRIVRILVVYDKISTSSLIERNTKGTPKGWHPLLGVCAHIRCLLLESPYLWAHIDLSLHPRWIDLCIKRAHPSPITIFFDNESLLHHLGCGCPNCADVDNDDERSDPQMTSMIKAIQDNSVFSLAQLINIMSALPCTERFEFRPFTRAGPLASTLQDAICSCSLRYLPGLRSILYVIDPPLWNDRVTGVSQLLQSTPNITHLVLAGVELSLINLSLPSLVRMEFHEVQIKSPVEIFNFLEQSPMIQHLIFSVKYWRAHQSESLDYQHTLNLACLRECTLKVSAPLIVDHLRLLPPPTDILEVDVEFEVGDPPNSGAPVLQRMLSLLHLPKRDVSIFIRWSEEAPTRVYLSFAHPGKQIGHVTHHWDVGLGSVYNALSDFTRIDVCEAGEYPPRFFQDAAVEPRHKLLSVQHVVLHSAATWNGTVGLIGWLRARVRVGSRVCTVELHCCASSLICQCEQDIKAGLEQLAEKWRSEGVADEILVGKRRAQLLVRS
jgi:hypothetical protein